MVGVFDSIRAAQATGDSLGLERGLKWYLVLHDVLLRTRRRGGRRGDGIIYTSFTQWRERRYGELLTAWQADRASAWVRRGRWRERRASLSESDRRAREFDRAMELIQDGQLSRAMRVLHTSGVAHLTEGVLSQLREKHPSRGHPVPAQPNGRFPRVRVHLTDTFRHTFSPMRPQASQVDVTSSSVHSRPLLTIRRQHT